MARARRDDQGLGDRGSASPPDLEPFAMFSYRSCTAAAGARRRTVAPSDRLPSAEVRAEAGVHEPAAKAIEMSSSAASSRLPRGGSGAADHEATRSASIESASAFSSSLRPPQPCDEDDAPTSRRDDEDRSTGWRETAPRSILLGQSRRQRRHQQLPRPRLRRLAMGASSEPLMRRPRWRIRRRTLAAAVALATLSLSAVGFASRRLGGSGGMVGLVVAAADVADVGGDVDVSSNEEVEEDGTDRGGSGGASPHRRSSCYLDENSVVLITGAAGFLGSELAMALYRTYRVKKLLLVDNLDSSFGTSSLQSSAASPRNGAEWRDKVEREDTLRTRTEDELALFEFKRQRAFHVLQVVGSAAHFYRADLRPSIPEFFDMGEVPLLDAVFRRHPDVTHVVHLADPYHGAMLEKGERGELLTQAVPRVKEQTKAGMIESLLEQLKKVGDERGNGGPDAVPHFVYASSFDVYDHLGGGKSGSRGEDDDGRSEASSEGAAQPNPPPFREDLPITTPSSLRGASKLIDEILAAAYHASHGIYSVGLRFFPVYGPWGSPGSSLFEMAERAVSDPESPVLSTPRSEGGTDAEGSESEQPVDDGRAKDDGWKALQQLGEDDVRDYVYIDDAVDALMAAMQYRPPGEAPPPTVINVGTGVGSTLRDVATEMEQHFPRSDSVRAKAEAAKAGGLENEEEKRRPTVSYAATDRAEALLGFKSQVPLKEGLANLLAWHHDRSFPYGGRPGEDAPVAKVIDDKTVVSAHGIESCSPFDRECLRGAPIFPCASECSHERKCTPSSLDGVAEVSRSVTTGCEAVLYTVAFGTDMDGIPSATVAVEPGSRPYFGAARASSGGGGRGSPLPVAARCNVAFVSEGSRLVQRLKREVGLPLYTTFVEEYRRRSDGTDVSGEEGIPLLRHGHWTLLPVTMPPAVSDDAHILWSLPKVSPGFFFGGTTRHALYADPNVVFADVTDLLRRARMQPKKDGTEGATACMVGEGMEERSRYAWAPPGSAAASGGAPKAARSNRLTQNEAFQERAYNMIRMGLRGEMPGGGSSPLVDSSWIVHTLGVEDARLFRCDVFGEMIQWDVSGDERAMEFVLGLHDLWSRVIAYWGGTEPWWAVRGVNGDITVIPEKGDRPVEAGRRQLVEVIGSDLVEGEIESEKQYVSDSENSIDESHAGRRRKLLETDAEEKEAMGSWMGVLSSTETHYFVRILPSSSVGVVHLDDFSC